MDRKRWAGLERMSARWGDYNVMTSSPAGKRMSRQKRLAVRLRRTWPLYALLAPAIIYLLVFHYYPMYGAIIAFKEFKINKGIWGSPWVGLKHFEKFISYYQFPEILRNTVFISLYSTVAGFVVRLVLSLSLHCMRAAGYKKCIQTVTYMPHFISTVVIVGMVIRFFNPTLGPISRLIQFFGGTNRDLMGVSAAVPHLYVWSGIWQNAGWATILYLATLSGVDPTLHEAAIVDGATRIQRVRHIDLPSLTPTIVITLIMDVGRIMSVGADKMLLMQNNLNLSTTQIISTYVYQIGIASSTPRYSYAAAISLFNTIINFTLLVITNTISKKLNQSSLW